MGIFVHISGSIDSITLIWVSLERGFKCDAILIKGDDVRSGTKANERRGRHRRQWVNEIYGSCYCSREVLTKMA